MTNSDRPNYFLLLELDPDEPWDQAKFDTQFTRKCNKWALQSSRGVQGSKGPAEARRNLALVDDIKEVMVTKPDARERERVAARQLLAQEEYARRAELLRTIDIMLEKGFLYDVEETKLRGSYGDLIDEPEPARLLGRASRRSFDQQPAVPRQLEPSQASTIRNQLDEIGEKSLYTLLSAADPAVGPASESAALRRAAEQLYRKMQRTTDKSKPGLAVKQDLAGKAMGIFDDEDKRQRYDNTLAYESVNRLLEWYSVVLQPVKCIDSRQADRFVREARDAGAEESLARTLLLEYFKDRKWTVDVPSAGPDDGTRPVRCRVCRAVNDPSDTFCADCGAAFRMTCPRCAAAVLAQDICGKCGFRVGERNWVQLLIADCEDLLRKRDVRRAQDKLRQAREIWQLPKDSTDDLAKRIAQCEQLLAQHQEQQHAEDQKTLQSIVAQMELRHYRTAHSLLLTTHGSFPERDRLLEDIQRHLDAADRLCRRAQQASSPEESAALYSQALEKCADHEDARTALRTTPPSPPRNLRAAAASNDLVHLQWQAASTPGVRYTIVRKRAEPPVSIVDGRRLATVSGLAYDDRSPEIGVPVYYGVFADREGTVSQAASTPQPLLLTQEVTITSVRVDDGTAELSWLLPPHAESVAVSRTVSPSSADGHAQEDVTLTEPARIVQSDLRNGVRYSYTLRAAFRDADGQIVLSAGKTVPLMPGPPPQPPGTVRVTTRNNLGFSYRYLHLGCDAPSQGSVVVLHTTDRSGLRTGERVLASDLERHGRVLDADAARGFSVLNTGLCYFTPVLIHQELGYVGEPRRYAAVDEVSDLTAQSHDAAIRLQWSWPAECQQVLVAYDHSGWPADPTIAEHQITISRDEYERDGHLELRNTGAGETEFFLLVAALRERDGETFASSGVRSHARAAKNSRRSARRTWRTR